MIPAPLVRRAWPPNRAFWLYHVWLPLFAFVALVIVSETTGIDLWLADRFYALEGGSWALRRHFFTYDVMHHYGKVTLIGFGLLVLAAAILSCCVERLKSWRRPLAYLATGIVVVPSLIGLAKHFSDVPCPYEIARYGGERLYGHTLGHAFGWQTDGLSCFPAGHASGGYGLLVIYFAAWRYARRPALFLLPGLVVGGAFGFTQQVRGAHFLSHDIWTMALAWFGAMALYMLFRPSRW